MTGGRRRRFLAELEAGSAADITAVVLCGVCRNVTGMSGAGIMLMSGDLPLGSIGTTGTVSALIEDLQYTPGEGPCVDAYQLGVPVLEPDLADPVVPRWQAFTGPALDAGVRAVFGFPLEVGGVRLGALNFFAERPGRLSDDQHADALVAADISAEAVLIMQAKESVAYWPRSWSRARTSSMSCTRRRGWSPPSSRSVSPRLWSASARTPSPASACWDR